MQLVIDPDYWFQPHEEDPSKAEAPDGTTGLILDRLDIYRQRKLRDELDRGEEPEEPLITRDIDSARQAAPAIIARLTRSNAPRLYEEYEELSEVFTNVSTQLRFADIDQLVEYVTDPTAHPQAAAAILESIAGQRKGELHIPTPGAVSRYRDTVTEIFDLEPEADVENRLLYKLVTETDALRSVETGRHLTPNNRTWLQQKRWIDEGGLAETGKLVQEYADGTSTQQQALEAAAVLFQAKDTAGPLLGGKLDEAIETLDIDTENLPTSFQEVLLANISQPAARRGIEAAKSAGVLERAEEAEIGNTDQILTKIKGSRYEDLKGVKQTLEQVPVVIYRYVPEAEYPPLLVALITALSPQQLIKALDTAIAEGKPQVEKTIGHIDDIRAGLAPILPEARINEITDVLTQAREYLDRLSPSEPTSPQECVSMYEELIKREKSIDFSFSTTQRLVRDAVLEECEKYISDAYRRWANTNRSDRGIPMIVDVADLVYDRFETYDHLVVIISDGFGLRQWIEGKYEDERMREWEASGALDTQPMTTVFPSETGAGHYSFLTGEYPEEHGRDDIKKTADFDSVSLFDRARDQDAFVHILTYMPVDGGFGDVMKAHADDFTRLESLEAEDSALGKDSRQEIAETAESHGCSLTVLQHNQIDQLHEGGSKAIVDTLVESVTGDVLDYIESLSHNLDGNVGVVVTADHGMVQTDHESHKNIKHGEAFDLLKAHNERYDDSRLGQRVIGLKERSSGNQYSNPPSTPIFEVLSEEDLRGMKSMTEDKCSGRVLRMKNRYYSERDRMTATHGAFTFDEMFIPFATFDLQALSE